MNEVILSGILKGEITEVAKGVHFTVVNKNERKGTTEFEEFFCAAYGNAAKFLTQHATSGKRVILQGRLASERIAEDTYKVAINTSRVIGVTSSSEGVDYSNITFTGKATGADIHNLASGTSVVNLNVNNTYTFTKGSETYSFTTFIGAAIWGNEAKKLHEAGLLPMKDKLVAVSGVLKPQSYTKRDGEEVDTIGVWANEVQVLGETNVAADPAPVSQPSSSIRRAKVDDMVPF